MRTGVVLGFAIAILFILIFGARGQEAGHGLICDTKDQVERYVKHYNEGVGVEASLARVNEVDENACGIVMVAFIRLARVGEVRSRDGPLEIVHIIVIGVNLGQGWIRSRPLPQFTIIKLTGEDA